MNRQQLNDHFKERVRDRIVQRLQQIPVEERPEEFDMEVDSYAILAKIIILADENNLIRAADRVYELKLANPATALSHEQTLADLAQIYQVFSSEVSILYHLYQMQAQEIDCTEIIANMELRLLKQ